MTAPLYASSILGKGQSWANADGAAAKKDLTAAATGNGMVVASIAATSNDVANNVDLYLNDGSTDWLVARVPLLANTGTDGSTPAENLLTQGTIVTWASSDGTFVLPSGWKLKAAVVTAVTAAKTVTLVALGGQL